MDPMLPQITEEELVIEHDLELHFFKSNEVPGKPIVAIFGWPSIYFLEQTEQYYDELKARDNEEMFYPFGEGATVREAVSEAMRRINRIPNEYKKKAIDRIGDWMSCYDLPHSGPCKFHISMLKEQ